MQRQPLTRLYIRQVHEIFFALNVAYAAVSILFTESLAAAGPFRGLEIRINHLLHIRQTDYIRGYFEVAIPTLLLAVVLWMSLRIGSRTRFASEALRSLAGVTALFLIPAMWAYGYSRVGWPYGWPFRGAPVEIIWILSVFFLLLSGKWVPSTSIGILVIFAHNIFWYWVSAGFGMPEFGIPGYFGPYGRIVA